MTGALTPAKRSKNSLGCWLFNFSGGFATNAAVPLSVVPEVRFDKSSGKRESSSGGNAFSGRSATSASGHEG